MHFICKYVLGMMPLFDVALAAVLHDAFSEPPESLLRAYVLIFLGFRSLFSSCDAPPTARQLVTIVGGFPSIDRRLRPLTLGVALVMSSMLTSYCSK